MAKNVVPKSSMDFASNAMNAANAAMNCTSDTKNSTFFNVAAEQMRFGSDDSMPMIRLYF